MLYRALAVAMLALVSLSIESSAFAQNDAVSGYTLLVPPDFFGLAEANSVNVSSWIKIDTFDSQQECLDAIAQKEWSFLEGEQTVPTHLPSNSACEPNTTQ
jgi:hypothetical protein